ncbi:hypothetical protein NPIL_600401 [Nephila pilipes]|uniref:Uncharacterized protein n=1 Tax=Nephila pilipes TaxID=299642 RepID=A0A8X6TST1_NEPPI|nr:hypothetical protein NPIL_600401 [Nephila pilipes]
MRTNRSGPQRVWTSSHFFLFCGNKLQVPQADSGDEVPITEACKFTCLVEMVRSELGETCTVFVWSSRDSCFIVKWLSISSLKSRVTSPAFDGRTYRVWTF